MSAVACLAQAAPSPSPSAKTNVDVLRPETCIPGAKLFYDKPDAGDDMIGGIFRGDRKPDAVIEKYDRGSLTVSFKRNNGKVETLKLSDPEVENWTVVYDGPTVAEGSPVPIRGPAGSWQTSWDGFVTLAEQELNRLSPNGRGPWEGKEVTWEGKIEDMEVMTAKNLVRLVLGMPERTLTIKGQSVTANRVMIFVPMQYENLGKAEKGMKIRFKTTIAPIDAVHPAVVAAPGKDGGKNLLLIFTKGGTILK